MMNFRYELEDFRYELQVLDQTSLLIDLSLKFWDSEHPGRTDRSERFDIWKGIQTDFKMVNIYCDKYFINHIVKWYKKGNH